MSKTSKTSEISKQQEVIVRAPAGVFYGTLDNLEHPEGQSIAKLSNARRVWSWSGAASLSQMAVDGVKNPKSCNFSVKVPEQFIFNVAEVIPLTPAAKANLDTVPDWKA